MRLNDEPEVAAVARMIGEPARAAMLAALLGGEWLPAGELARRARIAPATASEHLAQLANHRLIVRRRAGRHVYYALAGAEIAAVLESLSCIAAPATQAGSATHAGSATRAPRHPADAQLRFARTCYDHLAGQLGVLITNAMVEQHLLDAASFALTERGAAWFASLGIDTRLLQRDRRTLTRPCLDWCERRDHLAGAAAAALTTLMLDRRWIVRIADTRAVRLSQRGREGLRRALGLEVDTREPGIGARVSAGGH